jgi:hypothetical protein
MVMRIYRLSSFFFLILISGCTNKEHETEKIQKRRDDIVDVSDKIIDIKPEGVFGPSLLYILDDYLIINEINPEGEKGIHLYDKNSFRYITSIGIIGRGPGEISVPGNLGIDRINKILWVPDHGNGVMYKFPLDSILSNNKFKPSAKRDLNNELFIARFGFLNDSLVLGKGVIVTSVSSYEMAMAKLNINTNVVERYGYEYPEMTGQKTNSFFAMSVKDNFYVNWYSRADLMTICDLEGKLRYNVFGPGWFDGENEKKSYFFGVELFDKYIIASYIGRNGLTVKGNTTKGSLPAKFIVFDSEGNYVKTLDTGFEFNRFCVDEENNRIIAYFEDREEPLGYIDISFLF